MFFSLYKNIHHYIIIIRTIRTTRSLITGVPWFPKSKITFALCSSKSACADRVHPLCGNGASPAPNWGIRFTTTFGAAAVPTGATGAPKFFQCRVEENKKNLGRKCNWRAGCNKRLNALISSDGPSLLSECFVWS